MFTEIGDRGSFHEAIADGSEPEISIKWDTGGCVIIFQELQMTGSIFEEPQGKAEGCR